MSTFLITIGRASLSLPPLVLSGSDDEHPLGVTDYTEPAIQPSVEYAPDSAWVDGSMPLSIRSQQTIVGFAVCTTDATTETESRAALAELRQAIGQFSFPVTTAINGAPSETWTCHAGSIQPVGSRTFSNLENHDPEWSVTIPAHPVRAIGA